MEAALLIGLQASGKSTFYEQRLAGTHLRVSLDLAGTRAREVRLLESCLADGIDFAVDDTNSTAAQRKVFIEPARAAGWRVIGYFFAPDVKRSLERNAQRMGAAKVPVPGIYRTAKYFEPPVWTEGFDGLWQVRIENGDFVTVPVPREPMA
jgi:predicted kinase